MTKNVIPFDCVWVRQMDTPDYCDLPGPVPVELPEDARSTVALFLLRNLLRDAGLDATRYGTADWNPLGDLIAEGDRVLLKPNWVRDRNMSAVGGFDCLVTHISVIEAVLHYVVKTKPGLLTVGDAPVQGCDFDRLRLQCGLDNMIGRFKRMGHEIFIRDFRLTRLKSPLAAKVTVNFDAESYCMFDLGLDSCLAPITKPGVEFRVTQYDPDVLGRNHNEENHRYLIAREVIDADVIISLPKLKTHKKAGVTGALKNMVGINGLKEYLPHHRKGGSASGGDCYEGNDWLKKLAEDSLDRANREKSFISRYFNTRLAGLALRLSTVFYQGDRNIEGSWYGNDTVWRMCLDLQKILHYGKDDGKLSSVLQRKVLTITDAIVAGEGEGPMAPIPVPLGVMTLGVNVAALDWVHCLLMRLAPDKLPLVAQSFNHLMLSLPNHGPEAIRVWVNGNLLAKPENAAGFGRSFVPPRGWRSHCELDRDNFCGKTI